MKKHDEDGYSHVLKYTGIFGGVQGLTILIGLVRNKFMAVLLGVWGMGLASLMNSVQSFAAQSTNLGIAFGAIPRLSELYGKDDRAGVEHFVEVLRLWSLIAAVLGFVFMLSISMFLDDLTFTWGNHTLHFIALSPVVAMMAVTGGEMAILKGTRRLALLARIQIYAAVGALVLSVPLYWQFGHSGIVPAIGVIALTEMLLTLYYSYRLYPLRLKMNRQLLNEGAAMVKLGLSFVIAFVAGSATEMFVRSFLNTEGGLGDVGLYNVGYMITVTYAGLVFSAMETDFFPRLSAVNRDVAETNMTVNKQMEVSLLIIAPMLAALIMLLPVLIPLLFSSEFEPVIAMTQVAVLAMYLKVLTLPVAYITLARSYSLTYIVLESAYYVVFALLIVGGYRQWGLYGTGLAIVAAHLFDLLMVHGVARWRYHYRCSATVVRYAVVQTAIGLLAFGVTLTADGWAYWTSEAALTLASTAYSLHILRRKTHLWESLKRRLLSR